MKTHFPQCDSSVVSASILLNHVGCCNRETAAVLASLLREVNLYLLSYDVLNKEYICFPYTSCSWKYQFMQPLNRITVDIAIAIGEKVLEGEELLCRLVSQQRTACRLERECKFYRFDCGRWCAGLAWRFWPSLSTSSSSSSWYNCTVDKSLGNFRISSKV